MRWGSPLSGGGSIPQTLDEMTMLLKKNIRANQVKRYEVSPSDLPLSCPMDNMRLWDSHPRVYLPIEKTGHEICPYCSAEFFLKDTGETGKSH